MDPQRDLDILRTLRDAVHAGTHPLFRVPSKLRPLPKRVLEPEPEPVIQQATAPTDDAVVPPTAPPPRLTPPPDVPPDDPAPEQVDADLVTHDTDSLVSYEDLELRDAPLDASPELPPANDPPAPTREPIDDTQPDSDVEMEQESDSESDSDSDSESESDSNADSDLEVASRLVNPARRAANLSKSTSLSHPSPVAQERNTSHPRDDTTEVVVLRSDSEPNSDPDDVIFQDDPTSTSSRQVSRSPRIESQSKSQSREAESDVSTGSVSRVPTTTDTASPRPDGTSSTTTTEITSSSSMRDAADDKKPEPQETVARPPEAIDAARVAHERQAASAPTKGVSPPNQHRKESRGERKDREAREIAAKRARDKGNLGPVPRTGVPGATLSSSQTADASKAGASHSQRADTVRNASKLERTRQPAPATLNSALSPRRIQAKQEDARVRPPPSSAGPFRPSNNHHSDSRPFPPSGRHVRPRSPPLPPRPRSDRMRSLSPPPRLRPLPPPIDNRLSSSLRYPPPPPPRGRSPVPPMMRDPRALPPPPLSPGPHPPPHRRAPSLTRSIDGNRRARSRSPPLRRPISMVDDYDSRFIPGTGPPPLDGYRELPPPMSFFDDYRRIGPPSFDPRFERERADHERDRDYPLSSAQYRGPPPPPPLSSMRRSRSRSPPTRISTLRSSAASSSSAASGHEHGFRGPPPGLAYSDRPPPPLVSSAHDRWDDRCTEFDRTASAGGGAGGGGDRERRFSGGSSSNGPPSSLPPPPPPNASRWEDRPPYEYERPPLWSPPLGRRGSPSPPPPSRGSFRNGGGGPHGPPPALISRAGGGGPFDRERDFYERRDFPPGPPPLHPLDYDYDHDYDYDYDHDFERPIDRIPYGRGGPRPGPPPSGAYDHRNTSGGPPPPPRASSSRPH